VLQIREVPKPIPGDNEIMIRNRATAVTSGDRRVRSLDVPAGFKLISRLVFGFTKPRQPILGTEMAGEVEAVGKGVTKFRVGDHVIAFPGGKLGCYAEYRCMPEDEAVARKPPRLTWEEAAGLAFGGTTALHFLRKGKLQRGESVLINGASGAVGIAAIQLARYFGAEVTGICSTANIDLVRSVGASHVIDYTRENFTANGKKYDIIVDTIGTARYGRSKGSLKEGGRLLLVYGGFPDLLQAPLVSLTGKRKVIAGPAAEKPEDLRFLADLAEKGELRPVIDRRYSYDQIVEAHRYVDTGRKRGSVVIVW
jgi:NADPH:quinone reductase-like Zn-dependent oxidoreductase